MAGERARRRLAAILAADVVGYSKLMKSDEQGTLAALKAHRAQVLEPSITGHGGRVVKLVGDGTLAEFSSVANAVRSAIAVQKAAAEDREGAGQQQRIALRIGIHMGDVIVDDDDLYGDGVNVAARLEGQAATGGIALSDSAYSALDGQLAGEFRDLGEQVLKNITRPVRVWGWTGSSEKGSSPMRSPSVRPSIAVLPFLNLSSDPEQSYLADGVAEDILTGLARIRWLIVSSRNSSFAHRGTTSCVRELARNLGVRYLLEGSVRRAGERVRIAVQLIDAAADRHLWAERYDRRLVDIFDLQDEITTAILGTIEPEIGLAEQERARRKAPDSLDAWDFYLRGQWSLFRYTAADNAEAQRCFRRSIELDPDFAPSHAGLAYACHLAAIEGFAHDRTASIVEGVAAARRAISLDDRDGTAYAILARVLSMSREHEAALVAAAAGVDLNPNSAQIRFGFALALTFAGRPEEALAQLDEATRLSPHDPNLWSFMTLRAWALGVLRRDDEAAEWARRAAEQPNAVLWPHAVLAAMLGHLGRLEEARASVRRFREKYPQHDPGTIWDILPFREPAHSLRFVEGVGKAIEGEPRQ